MNDPDIASGFLIKNVLNTLDIVAPSKLIKFCPDKPPLSLKKDTLRAMAMKSTARMSKNRSVFKYPRNQANKLK